MRLIVYLSTNCNLNCKYCYFNISSKEILNFEKFKKAFEEYINIKPKWKEVLFIGGEPLLHKSLLKKCINYIHKKNKDIKISIFTNGTLIDKNFADFIKKDNNIKLIVSIDGNKYSNDINRIFKGNDRSVYEKVIENLKKYNLIKDVVVNIVVTSKTANMLYKNIIHLYNFGFGKIGWNMNLDDKWTYKKQKIFINEIKKILLNYLNLIKKNRELYEISNNYEIIEYLKTKKFPNCQNIILFPDGNFYICDKLIGCSKDILKNFKIDLRTNIREKIFKQIKYKAKGLFCSFGLYMYLKYVRKLKDNELEKKFKNIEMFKREIEKELIYEFKKLIKYKKFRETHFIQKNYIFLQ